MTSIYQRNSSTLKMTCKIYIGYVRHCDDANQKKKRKKKGKVYSLYLNLLKIPNVNLQIGTSSLTHMIFVHILQTFFSFFSRFRKKTEFLEDCGRHICTWSSHTQVQFFIRKIPLYLFYILSVIQPVA